MIYGNGWIKDETQIRNDTNDIGSAYNYNLYMYKLMASRIVNKITKINWLNTLVVLILTHRKHHIWE